MPTGSPILQSGNVTPGHLASFVTDGVLQDSGVALTNLYGALVSVIQNVNFNVIADSLIPIGLPFGYSRYRILQITISGATGILTTATCGVFTAPGASGVTVVAANTAVTINNALIDTNNNMQSLTIQNQNTLALSDPALYFRVQNAQGTLQTANVSVFYQPMP
jgi:hypothetical protein